MYAESIALYGRSIRDFRDRLLQAYSAILSTYIATLQNRRKTLTSVTCVVLLFGKLNFIYNYTVIWEEPAQTSEGEKIP